MSPEDFVVLSAWRGLLAPLRHNARPAPREVGALPARSRADRDWALEMGAQDCVRQGTPWAALGPDLLQNRAFLLLCMNGPFITRLWGCRAGWGGRAHVRWGRAGRTRRPSTSVSSDLCSPLQMSGKHNRQIFCLQSFRLNLFKSVIVWGWATW